MVLDNIWAVVCAAGKSLLCLSSLMWLVRYDWICSVFEPRSYLSFQTNAAGYPRAPKHRWVISKFIKASSSNQPLDQGQSVSIDTTAGSYKILCIALKEYERAVFWVSNEECVLGNRAKRFCHPRLVVAYKRRCMLLYSGVAVINSLEPFLRFFMIVSEPHSGCMYVLNVYGCKVSIAVTFMIIVSRLPPLNTRIPTTSRFNLGPVSTKLFSGNWVDFS